VNKTSLNRSNDVVDIRAFAAYKFAGGLAYAVDCFIKSHEV